MFAGKLLIDNQVSLHINPYSWCLQIIDSVKNVYRWVAIYTYLFNMHQFTGWFIEIHSYYWDMHLLWARTYLMICLILHVLVYCINFPKYFRQLFYLWVCQFSTVSVYHSMVFTYIGNITYQLHIHINDIIMMQLLWKEK